MQCLLGFSVPQHHEFKLDAQKLIRKQMSGSRRSWKCVFYIYVYTVFPDYDKLNVYFSLCCCILLR